MPAIKKIILAFSFFSLTQSFALVDYTEEEAFVPQSSGAASVANKAPAPRSVTKPKRGASSGGPSLGISMGASYGTQDVELEGTTGKVDMMGFDAQFQTRYNVFMSVSYYQAKSSDASLVSEDTGFQAGNPEVILGFNWLQFGKKADLATVDLFGGLSFGQKDSDFATERTDKIVGISTAKRFHTLAVGLGYEYRMTGTGADDEMRIGNISKLSASLGWVVSRDIRFLVEGSTFKVGKGNDEFAASNLDEDISFSSVKPQLQLKIGPMIDLTLGAQFRTRRLKQGTLTSARLWGLDAAYGNSVFSGLSFNI